MSLKVDRTSIELFFQNLKFPYSYQIFVPYSFAFDPMVQMLSLLHFHATIAKAPNGKFLTYNFLH